MYHLLQRADCPLRRDAFARENARCFQILLSFVLSRFGAYISESDCLRRHVLHTRSDRVAETDEGRHV